MDFLSFSRFVQFLSVLAIEEISSPVGEVLVVFLGVAIRANGIYNESKEWNARSQWPNGGGSVTTKDRSRRRRGKEKRSERNRNCSKLKKKKGKKRNGQEGPELVSWYSPIPGRTTHRCDRSGRTVISMGKSGIIRGMHRYPRSFSNSPLLCFCCRNGKISSISSMT